MAFHLAAVGAAVGLGSIWRFPYLTGTNGGSAFVFVFILAILAIATPLLVAEFIIGRRARRNPADSAGEVAASFGRSRSWNAIGLLGMWTAILIMSYYTIIAGWVMAYVWKCGSGELNTLARADVAAYFHAFLSQPLQIGGWHLASYFWSAQSRRAA
jgi:NSS family neurotransmitter:Na+ symporter